jgi:DNA-directed RNA polymerase subunit RPC12/RpoP
VHTFLKAPPLGVSVPEDSVPEALRKQPVAECPWCGAVCRQLLDEINHRPRRSVYKCSRCKQRTLPCKGKAHRVEGKAHLADEPELEPAPAFDIPAELVAAMQVREPPSRPTSRAAFSL